jgi:hypothetical protein
MTLYSMCTPALYRCASSTLGLAIDTASPEKTLVVQILSHTPIWVYALFFVLLVFGLMQTRTRTVRKIFALLLPVGMIAL